MQFTVTPICDICIQFKTYSAYNLELFSLKVSAKKQSKNDFYYIEPANVDIQ